MAVVQELRLGAPLAAVLALGGWFLVGPPATPETGRPFYDLHRYAVARNNDEVPAQRTTAAAYARVLERDDARRVHRQGPRRVDARAREVPGAFVGGRRLIDDVIRSRDERGARERSRTDAPMDARRRV